MQDNFKDINQERTVLITGGSGYVAGWIIIALLQRGYTVRTTVRSLDREASVRANLALPAEADQRLSFFTADLLNDKGWDAATASSHFIIHTASPMPVGEYKRTDVVRPAREGTLRVLRAGAKAGLQRVVLTSSTQAALPPNDLDTSIVTDETTWTDLSAKGIHDYTRAKTLAEQDAWEFIRQPKNSQMQLTTVVAGSVQGPVLGTKYSGMLELILRMLQGKLPRLLRAGFNCVDVRDLADLHIKAMEQPDAAGQRFVGTHDFLWMSDIASLLKKYQLKRCQTL
jgi:dihydroflavonol-4-reductase